MTKYTTEWKHHEKTNIEIVSDNFTGEYRVIDKVRKIRSRAFDDFYSALNYYSDGNFCKKLKKS